MKKMNDIIAFDNIKNKNYGNQNYIIENIY